MQILRPRQIEDQDLLIVVTFPTWIVFRLYQIETRNDHLIIILSNLLNWALRRISNQGCSNLAEILGDLQKPGSISVSSSADLLGRILAKSSSCGQFLPCT